VLVLQTPPCTLQQFVVGIDDASFAPDAQRFVMVAALP
jgi:hypothetical protein